MNGRKEFETTTCSLFVLKCAPQVSSNRMKVFYYYSNYNHTTQLAYLQIPLTIRQDIAKKLKKVVSMDHFR